MKVARRELAPTIRALIADALGIVQEKKGITLMEVLADEMIAMGLIQSLDKLGKYVERDTTHRHEVGESLVEVLTALSTGHHTQVESEPDELRH